MFSIIDLRIKEALDLVIYSWKGLVRKMAI